MNSESFKQASGAGNSLAFELRRAVEACRTTAERTHVLATELRDHALRLWKSILCIRGGRNPRLETSGWDLARGFSRIAIGAPGGSSNSWTDRKSTEGAGF